LHIKCEGTRKGTPAHLSWAPQHWQARGEGPLGAQPARGRGAAKALPKWWELPKPLAWEQSPPAALLWGSDVRLRLRLRESQKLQFKRGWKRLTRRKLGLLKDLGLQKPSTGMTSSNVQPYD